MGCLSKRPDIRARPRHFPAGTLATGRCRETCSDGTLPHTGKIPLFPYQTALLYRSLNLPLISGVQFGVGPRVCQGKNVAHLEMSKVIPQIIRTFDLELDDSLKGDKQWRSKNIWLVSPKGFKVTLKLREEDR